MKILAFEIEKPGILASAFTDQILRAEAQRAWELHQQGLIRELYFRADQHTAVLVLECASVEEAHQALDTLPLVHKGLIEFDFIPLTAYPGFSRLIV